MPPLCVPLIWCAAVWRGGNESEVGKGKPNETNCYSPHPGAKNKKNGKCKRKGLKHNILYVNIYQAAETVE